MSKNLIIEKVLDKTESYWIQHPTLFRMPLRMLVIGASQRSGKTNFIVNLLAKDEGYRNYWLPHNIFIISPSVYQDKYQKLIHYLEIPEENLFTGFDNERLNELYDQLESEFQGAQKKEHYLFLFDDVGFSDALNSRNKKENVMDRIFCNGRHSLISAICLVQKYTQCSTLLRENATQILSFEATNNQIEKIQDDHNGQYDKKTFMKKFKLATSKPHSFMMINYDKHGKDRYTTGLYGEF